MQSFLNQKIGVRLGVGFGLVIAMMLAMAMVAVTRFHEVNIVNTRIIDKEWVKAEAANTINATTRANARRTMELVIAADKAQIDKVKLAINDNKETINKALATLEELIVLPEGRALLATLKVRRVA